MSKVKELTAYRVVEEQTLPEVAGVGYILEHKKTKARVLVVENDDANKVFTIGFRTPASDSTGVPHIIEHTVLCGSRKYPVKDPFVELCKGSLNTFLNAMTYPDKTVYPVASCNDKDFHNLVNVYLDAVFYPNIYEKEEIFKQEGWHYELTDVEDELTLNGVVYNEMKGVYSSADQLAFRAIEKALFPDTEYTHDSGGYPEEIPELTRESYLEFHQKYYHPSNSYIYLYGNMDAVKELEFIDEEYLSHYEYLYVPSELHVQEPFSAPQSYRTEYSLSEAEDLKDNTYLSYSVVVGRSTDKKLTTAFDILEYTLLGAPGAPLKKAIIDAGICKDVDSSYDSGILQPSFSIVAHNANEEAKDAFIQVIDKTLGEMVEKGISPRSLEAAINHFEFKHKEGSFGRYPKGLMMGLDAFGMWLYDDSKALDLFSLNDVFTELRQEIKTGYFEELIRKYILENPHKAYTVTAPRYGLSQEQDERLKKKLAAYKATLSREELQRIVDDTIHLKEYQSEPSPAEDLAKIPLLSISDIDKEGRKLNNHITKIQDVTVVSHDIFTNGISYLELNFNLAGIDRERYKTVALLTEIFKYVDTDSHSYDDLSSEIDIETGGLGFSTGVSGYKDGGGCLAYFNVKMKMLDEKLATAMKLAEEILFTSHITDRKRLKEIIAETKTSIKADLVASGHLTASQRAASYISETYAVKEEMEGLAFYRYLDQLDTDFDTKYEALCKDLQETLAQVLKKDALVVSYTSNLDPEKMLDAALASLVGKLSKEPVDKNQKPFVPAIKNEGFHTDSQVQYVATAGDYAKKGYPYTGALNVLQVIFSYDYLWINVRVKGGAYGAMCSFARNGLSFFVSYRDPNLLETWEVYQHAAEYVEHFDADDRDMTKYVIGAISKMDAPLSPAAEGAFSFICYQLGITEEDIQKERDEVLATNQEDIRKLAPYITVITDSKIICAIGGKEKLEAAKDSFRTVENLY